MPIGNVTIGNVTIGHVTNVLVVGDLHIKDSMLGYMDAIYEGFTRIIATHTPTHVVLLGDTLHTHNLVHSEAFNAAVKLIEWFASQAEVVLIIGNHDYINNQQFLSDKHPFNCLKKSKLPITVVDTVTSLKMGALNVVAVPYVPPGRFIEALAGKGPSKLGWKKADVIFCHQEFKGCMMNAYQSVEGDQWSTKYPPVISGHVHETQTLPEGVFYTGTPYQHLPGDAPKKWVWVYDFGEALGPPIKETLGLKRKYLFTYSLAELEKHPKKIVKKLEHLVDHSIKVKITGNRHDLQAFKSTKTYGAIAKYALVNLIPDREMVSRPGVTTEKRDMISVVDGLLGSDGSVMEIWNQIKAGL